MIMQMTQKIRLTQRVDSDTRGVATEPEAIAIESSPVFSALMTFHFSTPSRFERRLAFLTPPTVL
jgi:hypothetical protein